jgi:hypothetical protein
MLDDLRNSTPNQNYGSLPPDKPKGSRDETSQKRFLGMSPFQRFIIVFLLFLICCVLVSFCLLLTERIVVPFF